MKNSITKITLLMLSLFFIGESLIAQDNSNRDLQYFRAPDQTGINVFEAPKTTDVEFDGINVRLGGSNTLQFQGLSHSNNGAEILDVGSNFNLATSNLDLDVQLAEGLRMHLRTYLSSRHHTETYVKGGYLQMDRLDFISEGLASDLMDKVRIKIGHMENNYGDAHFRRSDNGQAIYNPFVGNFIMDSFTTEVGAELYYLDNGFIGMVGFTNGKLNQSVVKPAVKTHLALLAKIGYDKQINDDVRVRLTGSIYRNGQAPSFYLYSGDRAGARYYNVLTTSTSDFRTGRFSPTLTEGGVGGEMTAIMINPFVKAGGLEFFGLIETTSGKSGAEADSRTYNQIGAELLYRFGMQEDVYLGGRYNVVSGEELNGNDIEINRFNIGGGWFMTDNVLTKIEYVKQTYDGFDAGSIFDGAEFSGIVIEAVVSF